MVHGPSTINSTLSANNASPSSGSANRSRSPYEAALAWREAHSDSEAAFDLWDAVRRRGWVVELRRLRAAEGGVEACTVPCAKNEFRIWVDDRPCGGDKGEGRFSDLVLFRLAHEVAHTLFYRPGSPPSRTLSADRAEEEFCDEFALALLGLSRQDVESAA